MTITPTTLPARPPSPWTGSRYETRHRWQLDGVRTLDDAITVLRAVADELDAAHAAGWRLTEPLRNGHLLAERASRRRRAEQSAPAGTTSSGVAAGTAGAPANADTAGTVHAAPPVLGPWRARIVDEPAQSGDAVLHLDQASATPVVSVVGGVLTQLAGPPLSERAREGLARQDVIGLSGRRWGVAPARVGPTADLVADGSALRVHAVEDGALVRTLEALTFQHGADRAATLPSAAAAYRRLADAAEAMLAAPTRRRCWTWWRRAAT